MSTFNKTYWAYMLGVVAAEYILGIVPKGTHDWNKFVHPMNLVKEANILGLELVDLQGTEYDPIRNKMNYTKGTDITYLIAFRKKVVEG